jgi:helicase MOV-10
VRPVRAIVGSQADHDLLRPKAPFVPRKRTTRKPVTEVLPGISPPALNAIPYVVKLSLADIPKNLSQTLSTGSLSDVVGRVRRIFLPKAWDSATYGRHFKNLIWIEEYQMEYVFFIIESCCLFLMSNFRHDLEMYDISGAKLDKHGFFYQ